MLWSTDAAGRVLHQSPTRPDAGCGVWHRCPCVGAVSEFFFFFTDSCQLGFYSRWFSPNWDDLARIKLYRPNQVVSADDWNGRNRPKSALNHFGIAKIGFEWGPNILNLSLILFWIFVASFVFSFLFCVLFCVSCLLLSLFCKSRHSNVFFKNILIVKIYIENINKNIFNNFLVAAPTSYFLKKLLSPAPAPKSGNAPMLHRFFAYCGFFFSP